jgi:hypothetical protein
VCRLDRPYRSKLGTAYPWTRFAGFSRDLAALAVRTGSGSAARNPQLLGASTRSSSRVLRCNSWFGPDVTQKNEPDGSTHEFDVILRDWPTGDGLSENTVRRVKLRYELVDAAADDPKISALWADGTVDLSGLSLWDTALWDSGVWAGDDAGEWKQLEGQAPEDVGDDPYPWNVNKRVRFLRLRFRSTQPASRLVLRSVEVKVRPTGKR